MKRIPKEPEFIGRKILEQWHLFLFFRVMLMLHSSIVLVIMKGHGVKMSIQDIIEGKKEWRAHVARVKELPRDYQIVYKEIQKYYYKVGPLELNYGISLLSGIIDLFEEGAAMGKGVLEVTGIDVAAFCDDLIKDSKTYADLYQESVNKTVNKTMKKAANKKCKGGTKDGKSN